jgi:predicted transcriptional regulator
MRLSRSASLVSHERGAFVMQTSSGRCYGMNPSGALVLHALLESNGSSATVADSLAEQLGQDRDEMRRMVTQYEEELRRKGILVD